MAKDNKQKSFLERMGESQVWKSIIRSGVPHTRRQRMHAILGSVFLHLHPARLPKHAVKVGYTWCMGGLSFFLFVVLTITGILLMFYYRPTVEYAYTDIIDLTEPVMGSVEIVDFRFNNELKKIGINNLISTNGASEYWIKGLKEFKLNEINLSDHPVKVFVNDKLKEEGNASNVLENPLNSLLWVINKLSFMGETLLKGNVVSTGTCTVAIPLEKK